MKKKSLITILAAVMLLVLSISALAACGGKTNDDGNNEPEPSAHTHTYATEWSKDETNHWHAATCEHTSEKKDEAAHTYGEWTETKAPTFTEKGEKQRVCSVCEYVEKAEIAVREIRDNTLAVKTGITLDKTYDKTAVAFTSTDFTYGGDGEVTISYKPAGGEFTAEAPVNAGSYVVKVEVAATTEWKAVSDEFAFTIAPRRLVSVEKAITVTYDGHSTEFDITKLADEKIAADDVKLVAKTSGFAVGSAATAIEFTGADKDNYTYDESKLTVTVGKARINIGHAQFDTYYKSGAWKTVLSLGSDNGVIEKDGALEDVSLELLHDNEWTDGKSYNLYDETANKGKTAERVRLVGADKDNYEFEAAANGFLDATLNTHIQKTKINGTTESADGYNWGGMTVEDVTFADRKFLIMGDQGEFTDVLINAENKYKQLKFEVFITGTTTKVAEGTRTLWNDGVYGYDYSGCTFIDNVGGPDDMTFSLKRGVEGYTDENGYWICEQQSVGFTLKVTETTKVVEAHGVLFGSALTQNAWTVVKYTHTAEDAYGIAFSFEEGSAAAADIQVFEVNGNNVTEVEFSGGCYGVTNGRTYYITIVITTAGTGDVTLDTVG